MTKAKFITQSYNYLEITCLKCSSFRRPFLFNSIFRFCSPLLSFLLLNPICWPYDFCGLWICPLCIVPFKRHCLHLLQSGVERLDWDGERDNGRKQLWVALITSPLPIAFALILALFIIPLWALICLSVLEYFGRYSVTHSSSPGQDDRSTDF